MKEQAPPAEAFLAVRDLIGLITNASACETRLISLRQKHSAIRSTQKKLDAERAAFDAYRTEETAKLEQEKKSAADVWATVRSREQALEAREDQAREDRRNAREAGGGYQPRNRSADDDGWTAPAGSGMGRTFTERRTVRHDDLGQPYAAHTTLTRTVEPE